MKQNLDYVVSGLSVLSLMGITACSSGDGSAGNIVPNALTIDVNDVTLFEGDAGTTSFDFTVTLSRPSDQAVTVGFFTADGSAEHEEGDDDYQSASGTLTFEPGMTSLAVGVLVKGDLTPEDDETFSVVLAEATGGDAQIGRAAGIGTILNQDAALSIAGASVDETDSTFVDLEFTVTLGSPLTQSVFVDYFTVDGTAQGSPVQGDFQPVSGTLVFEPGATQQTVTVRVYGDYLAELDETFTVELANAQGPGASIAGGPAVGTIVDDDTEVQVDGDPLSASWRPQIAASGQNIHVAWYDDRDGASDVYLRSSHDGGANWNETEHRLDTDAPGAAASTGVRIRAEGSNVYAVWEDVRNGGTDIYFNYSTDDGQTWQVSDARLNTDLAGSALSTGVEIASAGSDVYVAWIDSRNGAGDVYFNFSSDGGATWQANDLRLDTGVAGSTPSSEARIAVGDQVNVVWSENGDIYSNFSTDGGASWQATQIRVDTDPVSPNAAGAPRLAVDGSNVYVVWQDERNGAADIHFNQSFDGGASFAPLDKRVDNGDPPGFRPSVAPEICANGLDVFVVWQDRRQPSSAFDDIYFNRSIDGGANWFADVRVDYGIPAGKAQAQAPVIACEGQNLAIVWADARGGPEFDLLATTSTNGGESLRSRSWRLDSDAPGSAASQHPRVLVHQGRVFVVWEDQRSVGDVYFRDFEPH